MSAQKPVHYVFRDLPEMAKLSRIWGDGKSWGPEMDGFNERCEALSTRLFGVTTKETEPRFHNDVSEFGIAIGDHFVRMTREDGDNFDAQFRIADLCFEQKHQAYLDVGWDVSDGNGREHPLLHRFERPLICALLDLVPGIARLPPAPGSDAAAEVAAEEWARGLTNKSW